VDEMDVTFLIVLPFRLLGSHEMVSFVSNYSLVLYVNRENKLSS
jgi:hypothetical protein